MVYKAAIIKMIKELDNEDYLRYIFIFIKTLSEPKK